ncbi:MAG: site-specific integrase [Gallionellaceae bacterium]|nr:site-specific integrase [Gallionellaceae bacterium]
MWQAKIRRKGHPTQSKTFEAKKDAEAWARDIENKMDRSVFVDMSSAEGLTLKQALDDYEDQVSKRKDGYDVEKIRLAVWRKDDLAQRSMASLRKSDFAKWLSKRLDTVSEKTGRLISPNTAKKELAIISHLFVVAKDRWNLPVENPINGIEIELEDNSRDRRLEMGEEDKLIAALSKSGCGDKRANPWILPVTKIAIETAARRSELLAIKWADVDLIRSTLRIKGMARSNGKSRNKAKVGGVRVKFRDVPLSQKAKDILNGLYISNDSIKDDHLVFGTTETAFEQSFKRAVARAKLDDFHFHDLRHEATSRLATKLQIHELMKVTGHTSTKTLMRYYHPKAEDLAKKLG